MSPQENKAREEDFVWLTASGSTLPLGAVTGAEA